MWEDNSVAGMARHHTAIYEEGSDDYYKKVIISQKSLTSNIMSLCIRNSLTTDVEHNIMHLNTLYTCNFQHDEVDIFFVIIKIVCPDTHTG